MIAALAVIVPALMVTAGATLACLGVIAWLDLVARAAARRSSPTPYTTATPTTWER